jgi:hypothetical protein
VVVLAGVLVAVLALSGCTSGASGREPGSASGARHFPSVVLDTHDPAVAAYGYTAVDATPVQIGEVPAGLSALVWLGGYDNATCSWSWSDDQVRDSLTQFGLPANPRVLGYFLADEPNTDGRCPQASSQVRDRSRLVRSVDPDRGHVTLANIDDPDQFAAFKDSVDVLATDPYPCLVGRPCEWSMIPDYVHRLRAAGVTRYMAMLQAFQGGQWRWPTPGELDHMIRQWRNSDWCGALTFAWSYGGASLREHPGLLSVLRTFNRDRPAPGTACT